MGKKTLLKLLLPASLSAFARRSCSLRPSPSPSPLSLPSLSSPSSPSSPSSSSSSSSCRYGSAALLLPWSFRFLSSSPAPPPSQDLSITEACAKRILEILQEEGSAEDKKMLRVSVEGGGCSGFQYVFALDDKLSGSDRVFKKDGAMVVVDEISMDFLKGATIDYVEELIRSSFMVTQNPNASGGCGCGSSFNVK